MDDGDKNFQLQLCAEHGMVVDQQNGNTKSHAGY
jgi:hypothetical protein